MDIIKEEVVLTIQYFIKPISQAHNVSQKLHKKYGKDNVKVKRLGTSDDKVGIILARIPLEVFMETY